MNEDSGRTAPRRKMIIAGTLACTAAMLFLVEVSGSNPDQRSDLYKVDLAHINDVVDNLLRRHGIDRDRVKMWYVRTPEKKFLRVARRVEVTPKFVSVTFNRELNEELVLRGLRVVATERTRENSVTMHIKKGGTIIQSITFTQDRGS